LVQVNLLCADKGVLDDLEKIRELDKGGMVEHCLNLPSYCIDAINLSKGGVQRFKAKLSSWKGKISSIIHAGMGGSAIGGDLLKEWAREKLDVPMEVYRDYSLPKYADEDTLVFTVSYSGMTEETLSAFIDALQKGCKVVAVTSGGHLKEFAEKAKAPLIMIPAGMPPRAALPYLLLPQMFILQELGLVKGLDEELGETVSILNGLKERVKPEVPTESNESKKLASVVFGTVPLVLGYGPLKPVAERFKTQFNENSKSLGFSSYFPELDHNLIMGWEPEDPITKLFTVILLRSRNEPKEIKNRIEVTSSLAFSKSSKVFEVYCLGDSILANMLSAILVGDLASVYLAILRGIDPTPVKTIEKLKAEIAAKSASIRSLELKFEGLILQSLRDDKV